ncbi:serine/threonine protein kinase [bacterium]|nr:serine/threonine protein kinase [bacterium]MBP9808838.1 serine/threonine protein kinase [bacterium]
MNQLDSPDNASRLCLICDRRFSKDQLNCPEDGSQLVFITSNPVQIEKVGGYQIQGEVGAGNSGKVYKAVDDKNNQIVAIKILHQSLVDNLEMVNRFKKEAELSSRLTSPNTVAVKHFGILNDGRPFMVMDYIEGICAGTLIEQSGAMALERALPIFIQVAAGLAHAHELGIMHRDIKPQNIMLIEQDSQSDFVKIIDFGIAKHVQSDASLALTITGEAVGTPCYMSPEQCLAREVDHRTDIYSLGCVMYEMLTARLVFAANNPVALMTKHVQEVPPAMGLIPSPQATEIERIILKSLAKKPEDRYSDSYELKADLFALYRTA